MTAAIAGLATGLLTTLAAARPEANASVGWSIVIFALGVIVGCACVLTADILHNRKVAQQRAEQARSGGRVDA